MAHRTVLTARQRAALFDLATDQASLLKHYTLSDDDIRHIRTRRRPENQIGFALQLCAFRYPGRLLKPGEVIPDEVARFLAAQLGLMHIPGYPPTYSDNIRPFVPGYPPSFDALP